MVLVQWSDRWHGSKLGMRIASKFQVKENRRKTTVSVDASSYEPMHG